MTLPRFGDWPLQRKLLALVFMSVVLPLTAGVAVEYRIARGQLEESARALLDARVEQLAGELDDFHAGHVRAVSRAAALPIVRDALAGADRADGARDVLAALQGEDRTIERVVLLDAGGREVVGTTAGLGGLALSVLARDARAAARGAPAVSEVFLGAPDGGAELMVAYALPVRAAEDRIVGLVLLVARTEPLRATLRAARDLAGPGSFAVLLDRDGVRIGHSFARDLLFRPVGRLDPAALEAAVRTHRFGARTRELLETPVALEGQLDSLDVSALVGQSTRIYAPGNDAWNLCVARPVSAGQWTLLYLAPEASVYAPVPRLLLSTAVASLALGILALALGGVFAGRLARPVLALSAAALRLGRGDPSARVDVESDDEVGRLGLTFNQMAAEVAEAQRGLEEKVRERTAQLDSANHDLAARNAALAEKTAELARRQALAVAYGKSLEALAREGGLVPVVQAGLREVATLSGAVVMGCYRLEHDRLAPVAAIAACGPPEQEGAVLGGLAKEALSTGKTIVVDPVPDDVELRYDAILAGGRPRAVILTPLISGEESVGLLAVGTLAPPGPEVLSLLSDLAVPLALTIARHDLAETRDRYAEELARQNEELQAQGEELRAQSEELVAQQRELQDKNRHVERANELKSAFIANMSHELRTPLNAIIGFTEILVDETRTVLAPKQIRYLDDIRTSGRHVLTLIDGILDLARIEAGRLPVYMEDVDVRAAIDEALAITAAAAASKKVKLVSRADAARAIRADRGKLRQVLVNLVSNAVKFGPETGAVEVGARDEGAMVRFWIRDEGPGIDPELAPRLFQAFVQGERPLVKKHGGAGLGLAISKRLVELHGGTIGLTSTSERGSTFAFTIPACEPPRSGATRADEPEVAPVEAAEARSARGSAAIVLVITDQPAAEELLRATLEAEGFRVALGRCRTGGIETRLTERATAVIVCLDAGRDEAAALLAHDARTSSARLIVLEPGAVTRTELLARLVERSSRHTAHDRHGDAILVVDDHDLNRELVRALLERRGHRILLAADGDEAVEIARRDDPRLILMDLAMPGKDGFTAIAELKSDPRTASIPVVAVTALAMRSDEERARAAGFVAYLKKPVDVGTLERTVAELLPRGSPASTSA